jgi:hypothetical protein
MNVYNIGISVIRVVGQDWSGKVLYKVMSETYPKLNVFGGFCTLAII